MVSGPPAIGKTTVAKGLATEFNLTYLSGGDILKQLASEQGFSSDGDDWWDTEEIPEEELKARIALIHQKGKMSDLWNYRPIALLGALYQIYAACIRNRIVKRQIFKDLFIYKFLYHVSYIAIQWQATI